MRKIIQAAYLAVMLVPAVGVAQEFVTVDQGASIGARVSIVDIFEIVVALFLWFGLAPLVARSKGRRWWVWLLLSLPLPGLALMLVLFAHPINGDDHSAIS